MKIVQLTFKAGNTTALKNMSVSISDVTILVGPNNSGKSQTLQELSDWLEGKARNFEILESIKIDFPEYEEVVSWLKNLGAVQESDEKYVYLHKTALDGRKVESNRIEIPADIRGPYDERRRDVEAHRRLREATTKWATLYVNGELRFDLTAKKPLGDLQRPPSSHLVELFRESEKRDDWRMFCNEAFSDMYVALDPTSSPEIGIRIGMRPPKREEETALDSAAIGYHKSAVPIEDVGDGVRAFSGLGSVLAAYDWRYLLIDDPEAFLHPPAIRKLGSSVCRLAQEKSAQVFVSTHSSDFIHGCLDITQNVSIVRLTFNMHSKFATTNALTNTDIEDVIRHPLLRSTRFFDGLFYEGVIVTESDSDRVFYDEINRRLNYEGRGVQHCLFINAQNWQTIDVLIQKFRKLAIPSVGIFDFDVILEQSRKWASTLDAFDIPESDKNNIETIQDDLLNQFEKRSINRNILKKDGINCMELILAEKTKELLNYLTKFGIYVVPIGELESWLNLGIRKHGTRYSRRLVLL